MPAPRGMLGILYYFVLFMTINPEYRNVFYMRIGGISRLISWLCPPMSTLQIGSSNIGPGFFIQHGVATLISAERIGANCWINQQVTIGFSDSMDSPIIGDNVKIHAGAKVIGKLTVGDNATIGLNTVVVADVPANSTVFGIPAKVIWKKG
jgi:serine O-acetyltransferase